MQPRSRRAIRPRVYLKPGAAIGPGKIDLLRHVDETRSISAAARAMGMSYKRAWQLVDAMNRDLGRAVVSTAIGGSGGGGAELTDLGRALIARYAALEERVNEAARDELATLQRLVRKPR
jgi:molybdate transport system regulatory protein